MQGKITIAKMIYGYRVHKTYIGYSYKVAMKKFNQEFKHKK